MKNLTREEILETTKAIKGGRIVRVTYKTELPIKAEFKKQGYKIIKVVETSVRFGVNYHNIANVIKRKMEKETTRKVTNNYEWIIKDRIKHNTNTDKDYLVFATLPKGSNTKVKYILYGSIMGTLDLGDEIPSNYKCIVLDSYFNRSNERDIQTVSFENVIRINNVGTKVIF